MTSSTVINEVDALLREEARSDCVGLWAVLWEVRQRLPALTSEAARAVVLAAVRKALDEGGVVAGEFVEGDEGHWAFASWDLAPDQAIARIERDWSSLGREPNLGDIASFVAPSLLPLTALRHPMGRDWRPEARKK